MIHANNNGHGEVLAAEDRVGVKRQGASLPEVNKSLSLSKLPHSPHWFGLHPVSSMLKIHSWARKVLSSTIIDKAETRQQSTAP